MKYNNPDNPPKVTVIFDAHVPRGKSLRSHLGTYEKYLLMLADGSPGFRCLVVGFMGCTLLEEFTRADYTSNKKKLKLPITGLVELGSWRAHPVYLDPDLDENRGSDDTDPRGYMYLATKPGVDAIGVFCIVNWHSMTDTPTPSP